MLKSTFQRRSPIQPEAGSTDRSIISALWKMRYLFLNAHFPHIYLLLAALFFLGSRCAAQSNGADQNFKSIPQQVKTNAEVKATNRANTIANDVTDKIDSGMAKTYKGLVGLFSKKKKSGGAVQDSVGTSGGARLVRDSSGVMGTVVKDSVGVVPPVAKRG